MDRGCPGSVANPYSCTLTEICSAAPQPWGLCYVARGCLHLPAYDAGRGQHLVPHAYGWRTDRMLPGGRSAVVMALATPLLWLSAEVVP